MSDERPNFSHLICVRCGKPHNHSTETCCSTHQKQLCHDCYRLTHFVEVCGCTVCTEETG